MLNTIEKPQLKTNSLEKSILPILAITYPKTGENCESRYCKFEGCKKDGTLPTAPIPNPLPKPNSFKVCSDCPTPIDCAYLAECQWGN